MVLMLHILPMPLLALGNATMDSELTSARESERAQVNRAQPNVRNASIRLPFVYNFDRSKLPRFSARIEKMRRGLARPKIIFPCSSTARGHNAGDGKGVAHTRSFQVLLAQLLSSAGIPAESDSVYGSDDRSTADLLP